MLKILQVRLQQYMNCEIPDVQAGFRKARGARDQIANIRWIIEKPRKFQKNIASLTHDFFQVHLKHPFHLLNPCLKSIYLSIHLFPRH